MPETITSIQQQTKTGHALLKTGRHLLFWLVSYLFFVLFFGRANRDYQITITFTAILFPVAIATSYLINYYLIPQFLFKARYVRFALFMLYTLITTTWLEILTSVFVFAFVSDLKLYRLDPSTFDVVFLWVGLYFVILAFIAMEQLIRAFDMNREVSRLASQKLETELKLRESELRVLRSQIHPHFLFNTLNNLYGLTLEKSDLAPELVLKLADLMDYMLYKCNKPLVELADEIQHLHNYIEIEQLRYGDRLDVQFHLSGSAEKHQVAPMLLLAFFENAFKHGVSKSIQNPFVQIRLTIAEDSLNLHIANSCNTSNKKQEDYTHGIGLKNVQRRLDLLYPGHRLQIDNKADTFEIDLFLPLQANTTKQN